MARFGPPLQGLNRLLPFTQGVALGWYGTAPLGRRTAEPQRGDAMLPFTQGVALG